MSNLMLGSFEPQLVRFYKLAQDKIFHVQPFMHSKYWPRFADFEILLSELDFTPRDYSYTVTEILKKWCKDRNLKCVPRNVFTGNWALERYQKVMGSATVSIMGADEVDREALLYAELSVARRYIYENAVMRNVIGLRSIVRDMRQLLNPEWLELYDNRGKRPIKDAMQILNEEFGTDFSNYAELVDWRLING